MHGENSTKPDTTMYAEQVRARIQAALPLARIAEDPKMAQIAEYARRAGVNPQDWY